MDARQYKPSRNGLRHILDACRYSRQGLMLALRKETAFRLELALLPALIPLGLWLGRTPVEYALLFGSLLLVLAMELINSALETLADRISTDHHPLTGQAKDMGSAAVFLTLLIVLLTWLLIGWHNLA